jgi:filamentous hemagglutinin family protein
MPPLDHSSTPGAGRRAGLYARTALCGVMCSLQWLTALPAHALPTGGVAEVSAGGGTPTISTSGNRMDVQLNAERTVLGWTSFNVKPEETVSFNFGARNWIVLNRVLGLTPSKIEGVVEGRVGSAYGGNVWFTSQSSIIFGRGAQIDAGSLLVAIGTPDTASFLNPSNTLFSFSGGDTLPNSRVFVLQNAKVTAHGGMVALMGPTVATRANAVVSAANGSVLYGSAKTFQIRMAPGTGGDFDLVDFVVPNVSDGADGAVAIDLGGDTRADSVFLAAVSKSAIGSAVINLEGMVTAQAAKADGGDIVLSGGGGISNRAPAASLPGAAATDIYLNKASASRDLQVRNVGRMFGRPWIRPPEELQDPTTLEQDEAAQENGDDGGNSSCEFTNSCFAPDESVLLDRSLLSALFDPTAISAVTTGRDANIQASASIELGRIVAARDVTVQGQEIKANSLIASGALTATSTTGAVTLAGVGVGRQGEITGKTDVRIDAITAPNRLTVTSGRNITLGDGTSSVSGAITLTAPQNVLVELASGKIDSITAGVSADLRGGALDIGTVTAPRLLARAENVKIGQAVTSGDLHVVATNGDAIVTEATAGDDIFVIANNGSASVGSATLTAGAADTVQVSYSGNPDVAGNGRVVQVESTNFDARLGLGAGGVTGATMVTVRAGQDAVVDVTRETPGAFSVVAARDATLRAPTVRLDAVTAGRDLTVGSTTGDFTLTNTLSATRNVTLSAAGALRVADVTANAGSVTLIGASVTAGAVSASEDLTLRALTGGVTTTSYRTGRDLIVQGTTLSLGSAIGPIARDLSITSLGNFTASTPLAAGRNLTLDVRRHGQRRAGHGRAVGADRRLRSRPGRNGHRAHRPDRSPRRQPPGRRRGRRLGLRPRQRRVRPTAHRRPAPRLCGLHLRRPAGRSPGSGPDRQSGQHPQRRLPGGLDRHGVGAGPGRPDDQRRHPADWRRRRPELATEHHPGLGRHRRSHLFGRHLHGDPKLRRGPAGGPAGHPDGLAALHRPGPEHRDRRHRHRGRTADRRRAHRGRDQPRLRLGRQARSLGGQQGRPAEHLGAGRRPGGGRLLHRPVEPRADHRPAPAGRAVGRVRRPGRAGGPGADRGPGGDLHRRRHRGAARAEARWRELSVQQLRRGHHKLRARQGAADGNGQRADERQPHRPRHPQRDRHGAD